MVYARRTALSLWSPLLPTLPQSPGTELRSTTHLVDRSPRSIPMASSSSLSICRPIALRASGRHSVRTETPSRGPLCGSTVT